MSDAPVISVRGEAVLEADAEIAVLTATVQSKDHDRRRALDDLVARNRACLELIKSYGDTLEKVETGAVTITPVLKYRRREGDVHYYQGTVWIRITVVDFAVLGELITRLADGERISVDGPQWALRRDSEVYAEAARQAVGQAVERARGYAQALGCRLTGLVELADEGLNDHGGATLFSAQMASGAAMAGESEPEPIALEAAKQMVVATVKARFTTSQPEL
ncbi:SIMPL domain-containing protein [Thermomonospora umbrina]|uniref:SIMPL domain-containing protein n=1 Tax=Thermomonospora umbrina TaxID=111806 RepID=UPI000E24DB54|nr:SIMPL domain-containing protein [Thermomonospora umbrina]